MTGRAFEPDLSADPVRRIENALEVVFN